MVWMVGLMGGCLGMGLYFLGWFDFVSVWCVLLEFVWKKVFGIVGVFVVFLFVD